MSSGKVAKKIALFEINPPASLLPFGSTSSKFSSSSTTNNNNMYNSLLNRKDAIKRKKSVSNSKSIVDTEDSMPVSAALPISLSSSSESPISDSHCSSPSSYLDDNYGPTTTSSTASSCYSSAGDSGVSEFMTTNIRNNNRKRTEESDLLYHNSIGSDYSSNSNYENEGQHQQQQQEVKQLQGQEGNDYYDGSNRNKSGSSKCTNSIMKRTKESLTLTSNVSLIEKNSDNKNTSQGQSCGSNNNNIDQKLESNNRSLSTFSLSHSHGRKTLKDCYDSFSLRIVSGQRNQKLMPLKLVEFSDIKLDSEDDLDVDADDEAEVETETDYNSKNNNNNNKCQVNQRKSMENETWEQEELEMEPFYEELDDYDNPKGTCPGPEETGIKNNTLDPPRPPKLAWSRPKATIEKENEVENSSTTPTTGVINLLPPTTTSEAAGQEVECVYSEPVYNDMNNGSVASSNSNTNSNSNTTGTYWSTSSSVYNQSKSTNHFSLPPTNKLFEHSNNVINKTEPLYNFNMGSASYTTTTRSRHGSTSQSSCSSLQQSQYGQMPLGGVSNNNTSSGPSSGIYYDITTQELPPIPVNGNSTTKFSTIAKSAGKKIAKKFQYIRRLSRVGLDGFELPSNLSVLSNGTSNNNNNNAISQIQTRKDSNQSSSSSSCNNTYGTCDNISLNGSINSTGQSQSQYGTSTSNNGRNSTNYFIRPRQVRQRSQSSGNISCNGILTASITPKDLLVHLPLPPIPTVGPPAMKRSISRPSIPPPAPPPPMLPLPNPPSSNHERLIRSNSTNANNIISNVGCVRQQPSYNYNGTDEDDDDFDDSDFYDSDSELIRNFVAAVQPIYSMEEEPLYQYYTYGISLQPEDDYQPIIPKNLGLTLDMLVPRTGLRTLWCELPEVISSGILSILSDKQKQLQEAIFEILTSEVSYLKSLDVLISLFYENDQLIQLLTETDRSLLFGNITFVKDCAQSFLTALLAKWEESWYIQDVGQVIHEHANTKFGVYKEYCRNKPYQDKTLQMLRSTNDEFVNVISSIEENPKCQLLRMDSFLMLPMQRITRLPLLVNAIIQRVQSAKDKAQCEDALKSLTNLVIECNEAARESQDAEDTATILEKLEFPKYIKSVSCPGQFILKSDFMRNPFDHQKGVSAKINWTFQKNKRVIYWLILFTNQLIVAKKKSPDKFEVLDVVSPMDANIKPLPNLEGISKDYQHFFMLHFDRKETVYFLSAKAQSEVERWKQKLEQIKNKKEMKVEAIFPYEAKRPDELSFGVGEIITVAQLQPDGWYYGTKADPNGGNNGISGWFPGNYCVEC